MHVQNHQQYAPRYRAIPHGNWAQAIERIRRTEDPQLAFARFDQLDRAMRFLREAIDYAVMRREGELDRK